MRLTINVTADDIQHSRGLIRSGGVRRECCPIALAFRRLGWIVEVGWTPRFEAAAFRPGLPPVMLPDVAERFIIAFDDAQKKSSPVVFDVVGV